MEIPQDQSMVVGTRQSLKHISAGKAEFVILASDTDKKIALKIRSACREHNVPVQLCHSKKQLGSDCGISRDAAVVAVLRPMCSSR